MVARSLIVAATLVAAAAAPVLAQEHAFEGTVTMRSARGSQDFIMQATDNDIGNVGRLFEQTASDIMQNVRTTGGTVSTTELKVKGALVRADMPQIRGYLIFDAESGNIAMVRSAQYYTSFTATELQQLMGGMMPAGVPGAMASAMGGDAGGSVSGPTRIDRNGDLSGVACQWYESTSGDAGIVEGDALMQEGIRAQSCVTKELESAWSSFRAFMNAVESLPMMGGGMGAEAQIQDAVAEHGLPIITKTMRRKGGTVPSWTFEVSTTEVHEASLDDGIFSDHEQLQKLQLQEFMMRMMSGQ